MGKEWFESWFDSPYYHVLYKGRNDAEAALLIDNLVDFLGMKQGDSVWDLCCGKGRHSIYLNQKGFRTIGTDLSPNNICRAREHETPTLDFYVNDMRKPFLVNYFDDVFNLFTSFGYFKDDTDNHKVFRAVNTGLKTGGLFVIDYLNSNLVRRNIVASETRELEGITFHIQKTIDEPSNTVIKVIRFSDQGKDYTYCEQVKLFNRDLFLKLAEANGFKLLHTFGDYQLNAFDEHTSSRLVLVFQKS